MSPGVWDQSGQHSETTSLLKIQKKQKPIEIIIRRKRNESDNENNESGNIKNNNLDYKKDLNKNEEPKTQLEKKENNLKNENTIEKITPKKIISSSEKFPEKLQPSEKNSFEKINKNINEIKDTKDTKSSKKKKWKIKVNIKHQIWCVNL